MKLAMKVEPNEKKLTDIVEAGYEAVEVYTAKRFINQEYIDMLKSFPLKYSTHAPVKYCNDAVFDFAKEIGSETVTVHCTYEKEDLDILSLRATNYGLTLCLENEGVWGEDNYEHDLAKPPELETVHNGSDFVKLNQDLPFLAMTFDTEHAQMRNSLRSFWALVKNGLVKHMHTSGYNGTRGSWHSPPLNNEGMFKDIVQKLKAFDYEGFLTVEMHMKYHTKEEFQRHIDKYKEFILD